MDILKVLSRGIKQPTKKPGNAVAAPTNLFPSAGVPTNPQLFHDEVGPPRKGTKRKRQAEGKPGEDEDQSTEEELSDVDFFAPKTQAHPKTASNDAPKTSKPVPPKAKNTSKASGGKRHKAAQVLELDECKRIMRSHRLKFTLMPIEPRSSSDSRVKKSSSSSKKKKRKAAEEAEEQAKDHKKKQLVPQPLVSFAELRSTYCISPRLADNLARDGYKIPTEVQLGSLPLLLDPEFALRNAYDDGSGGIGEEENGEEMGLLQQHGVDFLAVAPTGSGKTLSFLIPAIDGILRRRAAGGGGKEAAEEGGRGGQHCLEAIVVAPTRELASQIANEGRKLAMGTGVRVVLMRKGMRVAAAAVDSGSAADLSPDEEDVFESDEGEEEDEEEGDSSSADDEDDAKDSRKKRTTQSRTTTTKADILITTPMLLLNFLTDGASANNATDDSAASASLVSLKKTLPQVRTLALDEADVLLDPLFRDQTLGIWSACVDPSLRVTFWSATMGSNIESLILSQLRSHHHSSTRIRHAHHHHHKTKTPSPQPPPPLVRLVVGLKDAAVPNIAHRLIYTATEAGKLLAIRQLLHQSSSSSSTSEEKETPLRPPFLIFTQTIPRATALHDELKYDIPSSAGGASRIAVLHSSLPPSQRSSVIRRFRAGEVWVLITTDVLSRGVDFAGVNGVVNYDVPGSAAAYVHRAGRTGRAGREGGVSVTLYTKEDIPFVKSVANVIAVSERQKRGKDGGGGGGEGEGVQKWLLDALPDVSKRDRKTLKEKGVESRRNSSGKKGGGGCEDGEKKKMMKGTSRITSKSAWERKKDNNRRGAIEASKRRKVAAMQEKGEGDADEWGGIDD